jgi:hypothetical protein
MTETTGFSIYTVMVSPQTADTSVNGIITVPEEVYVGDDITITASLVNNGDLPDSYEAILSINDVVWETKTVDVPGKGTTDVSFNLVGLESGTYTITVNEKVISLIVLPVAEPTPASFTLSSLEISPDEVDIGEEVSISIRVENTGETEGTCQIVCKINGLVQEEREISLQGLSGDTLVFNTTFGEAGKQLIEINDQLGSLIVRGEVSPPEQIPLPADDGGPTKAEDSAKSERAVTAVPTQDLSETSGSYNTKNWQIIIPVAGAFMVGFVILTILVLRWRRRDNLDRST